MRRSRTVLALVLAAAVTLTACGSDDDSSSGSSTSRAGSDRGSAGKAVVVSAENATLGKIAVDEKGLTVYTLTDADGRNVPCQGSCLEAWPPVLIVSGTSATGGGGVRDVGSVDGPEGKQATIAGLPVYTFAGDAGPGDANGDGVVSFGGTWKVVKVSGASTGSGNGTGSTNTTETTKPPTSSPDDGY
jgi:predicted lipoprotein with Yx(FWY)xxD motif